MVRSGVGTRKARVVGNCRKVEWPGEKKRRERRKFALRATLRTAGTAGGGLAQESSGVSIGRERRRKGARGEGKVTLMNLCEKGFYSIPRTVLLFHGT